MTSRDMIRGTEVSLSSLPRETEAEGITFSESRKMAPSPGSFYLHSDPQHPCVGVGHGMYTVTCACHPSTEEVR